MANTKKKKEEVEVDAEAVQNPLEESAEFEKEQAQAGVLGGDPVEVDEEATHLLLTRSNLTFVTSGFWLYRHDGSIGDCKIPTAFKGQMASEFNMRVGDVVQCSNLDGDVIHVVIPE